MVLNGPVKLTWPFLISVHPQRVCDGSQWSCQVDLTISQSLSWSILREYVMVLKDPVSWLTISNLCPSLVCMWWFSMILSSWPDSDHFPIFVHSQGVCDSPPWSYQVDLTICQSLSILSKYVMVLNDPVKLTWPFPNLCHGPSSVCMWWFSMILSSQADHFPIPVHPQQVCDGSSWSCQVDLTISQSLSILSLYAMILNTPVQLTWSFHNFCPSPGCMCHFSVPVNFPSPFSDYCIHSKYVVVAHLTLCTRKLTCKCLFQGSRYWYSQPLPVDSIILCFFITSLFRQCPYFKT